MLELIPAGWWLRGEGRYPWRWMNWLGVGMLLCHAWGWAQEDGATAKSAAQAQAESQQREEVGLVALAGKDWPLYRGDPQSQGYSPTTLPQKPLLLWEKSLEGTSFESTPIIVAGRVYLGDLDGEFYAMNLGDGAVVWKHESDSGYLASGAFHDGRLLVADYDGLVRCLNAQDGKELWSFQTDSQIDAGANFYKDMALITSEDGRLYALGLDDGKPRWTFETGDQLRCSPTIAGQRTFLGGCDGMLHIVNLDQGIGVGEGVSLEGPTGSTPAAHGPWIVAPTHAGAIFGIQWQSGERRWTFSDQELSQEIQTSPAIHDDLAFVVTKNRRCLAIKLATGELVWQHALRKPSDASPVVCSGRVWLGCSDGRLIALDEKTGQEVWMVEHQGKFKGSVAVADGRLVVATERGSVLCYGTPPATR